MSLSEIRNQNARRVVKGGSGTYRFYLDTVDQLAAGINPEDTLNRVDWLIDANGSDLGDVADVLLLRAQALMRLPATHPRHADTIPTEVLHAIFDARSGLGQFHRAAITHTGHPPAAQPAGAVAWPVFHATWPVATPDSVQAGWALRLITTSGDYDTARSILTDTSLKVPVTHAAWMALYWHTERWVDLHQVAIRAREATFIDPQAGPGPVVDHTLADIAAAAGAMALVSLGRVEEAAPMIDAAKASSLGAAAGYGHYLAGMVARAEGDEQKSATELSRSLQAFHTTHAQAALTDPDKRLRTTSEENINARSSYWDVSSEPDPEMERKRNLESTRAAWREQADTLMGRIVGMNNVKGQVRRIRNEMRVNEERRRRSGSTTGKVANYNTVLMGPPGTGKSTIVKVLTLYFAAEGIVEDPDPMITGKADFVSQYIGETPTKTTKTVKQAKGKVLFIDEFYDMVQDSSGGATENHGQDAIDTLTGLTEECIGETVFIIAGYPMDMDRVLQTNDGLDSRFPRKVLFDSFDQEQFAAVAVKDAEDRGLGIADDAQAWLRDPDSDVRLMFQQAPSGRLVIDVLGNGRFARNLIERANEELAQRLADVDDLATVDDAALTTLTLPDIRTAFTAYVQSVLYGQGTE